MSCQKELAEFMRDADPRPRTEPGDGHDGGLEGGEARAESGRCLQCDCFRANTCRLRRYADEYGIRRSRTRGARAAFTRLRGHAEIVYEPGKCVKCGICVRIAEREREPLGLAFIGRGFDVRVGVPFNEDLAAGLRRAARACAAACPTGALSRVGAERDKA